MLRTLTTGLAMGLALIPGPVLLCNRKVEMACGSADVPRNEKPNFPDSGIPSSNTTLWGLGFMLSVCIARQDLASGNVHIQRTSTC